MTSQTLTETLARIDSRLKQIGNNPLTPRDYAMQRRNFVIGQMGLMGEFAHLTETELRELEEQRERDKLIPTN